MVPPRGLDRPLFSRNKRGERRVSPPVYRLLLTTDIVFSGVTLDIASAPATILISLSTAHVLMLAFAMDLSVYRPWGRAEIGRRRLVRPSYKGG